ncbi:glutamate 5-kinase [bacterium (Candidatus Howlettbacteria) CG23_combo_of_CG06-09_8_20_14_all_37_9]|nr:MAG: glutamate 5-kinase [bacterium (Candidatus Howlettbacteria) CG23_combo_of_CG06-09_8_20_14_all_37_9]
MEIIVIKIGSSVLTDNGKAINENKIRHLASQISLINKNYGKVILVTSGAIAAGIGILEINKKPSQIIEKQALAAVGQSALMHVYEKMFKTEGIKIAQVLLSQKDFNYRPSYLNARNVLYKLLEMDVVPIINENDTTAIEEIKFGDNDNLSFLVASMIRARKLILVTDVDGLFNKNPQEKGAKLIKTFDLENNIYQKAYNLDVGKVGTGGMLSKISTAGKAVNDGIDVYLVNGNKKDTVINVFKSSFYGTYFLGKDRTNCSKKSWLAFATKSGAFLTIDDGAKEAIVSNKSLLPSGIKCLDGNFLKGDLVNILDKNKKVIGKGIVNYDSKEINSILGAKSEEIEKILGYRYSDEIIHKDNLVII